MYSEAVGTYYRISIQILFLSLLASYHCVAFTMSSRHLFGTGTTIARAPSNTFIANTVSESAANGEVSKPPFPSELASYEFLDAGAQMRFEKFGKLTVARSCISATRDKSIPRTEWASADLTYEGVSGKVGMWTGDMSKAEDWRMRFQHIVLGLAPSEMGQVGVFPEQHKNWDWTSKKVKNFYQKRSSTKPLHILNAFAYTGAATIACCVAPTVQVTNLDASKSFTQQAKENYKMSAVQGEVRWIVDDCKTFMRREVNRIQQNERPRYDGIILDPPAFGRFGNKVWKIDEDLPEVLAMLPDLLTDEPLFVLLTSHDINWPGDKLKDSLTEVMNKKSVNGLMEFGTMYLKSVNRVDNGKPTPRLEMGTFARWARKFV